MSSSINFYEKLPKQYKGSGTKKYKNYSKIHIDVPCRMLICGSSGSGKTNTLLNIIHAMNAWDRVLLVARQPDQPLYKFLKDTLGNLMRVMETMGEFPPLEEFNPKEQTLVVFDDLLCEDNKTQKRIAEIFVRGRHRGLSPVYLTQSYFQTFGLIRKNCDILIILKINTVRDLNNIVKEYSLSETSGDELMKLYNKIKAAGFGNYLTIDTGANDPKYKYRFNLEPLEDKSEMESKQE